MPGPVSESYDSEWGTSSNAHALKENLTEMHKHLSEIIKDKPKYILNVIDGQPGPNITATLTEQQWRILRFACERAEENI